MIRNVGNDLPFSISRHFDRRVMGRAVELLETGEFDVVLLEDLAMAPYGPELRERCGVPTYVRTHNIDTQVFERFVEQTKNPLLRPFVRWQLAKMKRCEHDYLAASDGYCVLSEDDVRELCGHFPDLRPIVVGNGTDIGRFVPNDEPRDPDTILHLGSLTDFIKLDDMLWFCREVLPRVRARRPAATLHLIGPPPSQDPFSEFEGVVVHGRVEDDLPYYHRGGIFIAPQFGGGGVRLKIMNAMAMECAIVATRTACEGIDVVDGVHVLLRDDPEAYAGAILELMEDEEKALALGRAGRKLVESRYAWSAIVPILVDDLRAVIERGVGRT
jgi:glycosyltransferase involved in cell wall biosynthesis